MSGKHEKNSTIKNLLDSSRDISFTKEDMLEHKKTIDIVNARETAAYCPVSQTEENEGITKEQLHKAIDASQKVKR